MSGAAALPRRRYLTIAAEGAVLLLFASAGAAACGGERQPVAVAADRNAVLIADFARTESIAQLAALAAPRRPDARPDTRFAPAELTVWEVSGTLRTIAKDPDGNYRLVIADPDQPELTLVAVAPDPACTAGSRFSANILAVRHALDRTFGPFSQLAPDRPVTATGIGFFSAAGSAAGAAPNGFELAPLIGVAFP